MFNRSHVITSKIQLKLKRWSSKLRECVCVDGEKVDSIAFEFKRAFSRSLHMHCEQNSSSTLYMSQKELSTYLKASIWKSIIAYVLKVAPMRTLSCHSTFFLSIHQQISLLCVPMSGIFFLFLLRKNSPRIKSSLELNWKFLAFFDIEMKS